MHPNYQMNGHPYQSSPSPFHQPAPSGSAHNGHSPHVGPGIPAPYPYAVHPSYAPHGYPSYPQYPAASSMMMYAPAGPSHVEPPPQEPSPPPQPASATGKRKRKYPLTRPHAHSVADAILYRLYRRRRSLGRSLNAWHGAKRRQKAHKDAARLRQL